MTGLLKKLLDKTFPVFVYRNIRPFQAKKKEHKVFNADLQAFRSSAKLTKQRFDPDFQHYPILSDKTTITPIEPHYIYHPAWAARVLAETKPARHIDISSTLSFSTVVSAFIPVDFYDYRPADLHLSQLNSKHADLTKLHFETASIPSLSCMHTLEHIGLGRYGDQIDYDGDLKAMNELKRVLAVGGDLLIVTPVGRPRIEYNAHRIYAYEQIISYFSPLKLHEFSLVPDHFENVGIIKNATAELTDQQNWGCGCFWFKKTED